MMAPFSQSKEPPQNPGRFNLSVVDWGRDAAEHYAEIRADLKRKGQSIGSNDLMIAAHARSLGAIVVTNNVKDFRRVKGLRHENWMQ